MNAYFLTAAALAFGVGLVHSVLGEMLVFRRLRQPGRWMPTRGGPLLGEGHVRILWATWHALTVLGWCLGALLLRLAMPQAAADSTAPFFAQAIALAMLAGSACVFIATRARHPGWIGLLAIAVCAGLGLVHH